VQAVEKRERLVQDIRADLYGVSTEYFLNSTVVIFTAHCSSRSSDSSAMELHVFLVVIKVKIILFPADDRFSERAHT
jgi:hypothetical protein